VIFTKSVVDGAFIIEPMPHHDERGNFARIWCQQEFEERGLASRIAQCSVSVNQSRGTLRGLHYQAAPCEETKVVRCTAGAIYDVVVDLRRHSPTYLQHVALVLSAANRLMMYVPEGCAHGFQTLEDDTEISYQMSEPYSPAHGRGVRWNDPAFGIEWPLSEPILNERDRDYPDYLAHK
jgi:dTDP-4-dehydrorhamnose 3,5-epimerase